MKEYEQKIHNIINNAEEDVIYQAHQAYKQGYDVGYDHGKQDGYEDGQKSLVNAYVVGKGEDTLEDIKEAEYNRGLADSWNVIKKITRDDSVGGYSIEMMQELFGQTCVYDITHNYTPEEAIAKIKAYEDKKKQDDWRDIPSEEMTLEQARRAVKELRTEVLAEMRGAENDK